MVFLKDSGCLYTQKVVRKETKLNQEPIYETGFFDEVFDMYKHRRVLRNLKQDIDSKEELAWGYVQLEKKYISSKLLMSKLPTRILCLPENLRSGYQIQHITNELIACRNQVQILHCRTNVFSDGCNEISWAALIIV